MAAHRRTLARESPREILVHNWAAYSEDVRRQTMEDWQALGRGWEPQPPPTNGAPEPPASVDRYGPGVKIVAEKDLAAFIRARGKGKGRGRG